MKKIIILASERSGTNLLRTLLGNHQDISAPVAPHLFDTFISFINLYGDLNQETNSYKLVRHMFDLCNHSYTDWDLKTSPKALINQYKVNSFQTAFHAMNASKALQDRKKHYACKDNHMFDYVFLMESIKRNNDTSYIYLYRDPRDHIASWLRTPLFMHTAYQIAIKWRAEQRKILDLKKTYGIDIIPIKYENLITNSKKEMTQLLENLEVDIDERCFSTNPNNKESKRNEFWKNLSQPIIKSNSNKYKKYLHGKDLLIVESLCKELMDELEYESETSANWWLKKHQGFSTGQKIKTVISKNKNKELFNVKMADLQDKLKLINSFKIEASKS